jgi:glycosyltransferase involved in cell wall biosynthesis
MITVSLNILVITAYHPPYHLGGYELRCKNVLDALVKRGHKVTVVTDIHSEIGEKAIEENIYRVLHATRSNNLMAQVLWDIQDIQWVNKLIHLKKIDVLYLWHTIVLSRTIFPFVAELKLPVVYDEGGVGLSHAWTKHGDWINFCDRKRTSRIMNVLKILVSTLARVSSGGILPISWSWPENMSVYFNSHAGLESAKEVGIPINKPQVIYSGLSLEKFPYKKSIPFSKRRIRLLVPGRIARIKAVDLAIKILESLKTGASQQQFEMVIVGPVTDEIYFKELRELIGRINLQSDVQFLDHVDYENISSLYCSAEFCLFPSQQMEGLSRVPLEAMASGSLVFSTGNEGSKEIIENGTTGYILSFEHPGDIARIIFSLVDNNSLYQEIINNARKKVEEHFAIEKSVDQIEQVLINTVRAFL